MDIEAVKFAARFRWVEILQSLGGLSPTMLDPRKNGPCPKCGGTDRFNAFKDVAETGGVNCRKCHSERNSDGIATLQWLTGLSIPEVVKAVATFLNVIQTTNHNPRGPVPPAKLVKAYEYRDETGAVLFRALRFEPKAFRQQKPDGRGGWVSNLDGVRLVPYRLPQVLATDKNDWLFVCEGEKDCDTLEGLGLQATCNPMGAGKWRESFSELLRGRMVAVLPDNDDVGQKHGAKVAASLLAAGCRVRVVPMTFGKDVTEYMAAGGTKDSLLRLVSESVDLEAGGNDEEPEIGIDNACLLVDAMRDYLEDERAGRTALTKCGIPELDTAIAGGVAPGEMMILAARPSHGKSAIALQFIHHWTMQGLPCAFISEEMSKLAIGKRSLQYTSEVAEENWQGQHVKVANDIEEYARSHAPAYVIEFCHTIDKVVLSLEQAIEQHGIKCAVVDYVQILEAAGREKREQVSRASVALRQLAIRSKIVLCVLCQISREIEGRKEFVPRNSDLKESGQLEQDADVIVHLAWHHRISGGKKPENVNRYTMFVGKNRNRAIVTPAFDLHFEPSRQRVISVVSAQAKKNRQGSLDDWNNGGSYE